MSVIYCQLYSPLLPPFHSRLATWVGGKKGGGRRKHTLPLSPPVRQQPPLGLAQPLLFQPSPGCCGGGGFPQPPSHHSNNTHGQGNLVTAFLAACSRLACSPLHSPHSSPLFAIHSSALFVSTPPSPHRSKVFVPSPAPQTVPCQVIITLPP